MCSETILALLLIGNSNAIVASIVAQDAAFRVLKMSKNPGKNRFSPSDGGLACFDGGL